MIFLEEIPVSKQCRPWSDAAFCGIWSGSTLFALESPIYGTPDIKCLKRGYTVVHSKNHFTNSMWATFHWVCHWKNKYLMLTREPKWATTGQNQQNECAPSKDSDKLGHRPSLIWVFTVRSMGSWGPKVSSCGQRRLWSDWADAQADLSLRWAYTHFVGFVMSWLKLWFSLK